jgi:hypothetical protein
MRAFWQALGFAAGAYTLDVIVRPQLIASKAIARARAIGKPVINVGAGTPGSSLRSLLLGPTLWGDVNIDIAADPHAPPGPGRVSYGDAHRLSYPPKFFGALIASHVLEHMDDPWKALREFHRVADEVYVITPRWWAPHTWLHPGHQWVIDDRLVTKCTPLWRRSSPPLLPARRS